MGISDVYSANMIYQRGRYEINPINYTGIIIPITIFKKTCSKPPITGISSGGFHGIFLWWFWWHIMVIFMGIWATNMLVFIGISWDCSGEYHGIFMGYSEILPEYEWVLGITAQIDSLRMGPIMGKVRPSRRMISLWNLWENAMGMLAKTPGD